MSPSCILDGGLQFVCECGVDGGYIFPAGTVAARCGKYEGSSSSMMMMILIVMIVMIVVMVMMMMTMMMMILGGLGYD